MKSLNNTGDYLELLHEYLTEKAGEKALVLFEEDIEPQSDSKPLIIIPMVEIDNAQWSDDGRHQDDLIVSLLVKIPHNLDKPSVQALNVAGFIRGTITDELFCDHLNREDDQVDAPEDINGQPLKWNTNERGYEVGFIQTVRYSDPEKEPFELVAIDLKQRDGDTVRLYESGSDQDNPRTP
ncbi:conserved hypothetical protein [Vibrio chagasii]|nr:conserved hypothetical protein [Vibrio chagasii]